MTYRLASPARRRRFNSWRSIVKWVIALLAVLAILVGMGAWTTAYYLHESSYKSCQVIDKDRTSRTKGGSDARVYTENCGTFIVADNWLKGDTNSADRYAKIKVGHRYTFTATGWRFSLTSNFPNIIESHDLGVPKR